MEWENLLTFERFGYSSKEEIQYRSQFQRDFDRILFSSSFRRLQDKTQVFPLAQNYFVHNRFTHSLEASCVGRSLGHYVGEKLIENGDVGKKYSAHHIGDIVKAAALVHDIGNPPFGHAGEDAISEYFKNDENKFIQNIINNLNQKEKKDLINFEGNAQGLRILLDKNNGIRLTYATIASFIKYPKENVDSTYNDTILKKYGCFQTEVKDFKDIAEKVGLINLSQNNDVVYYRHPFSFLVEAADDICYTILDIEDGIRLGIVHLNEKFNGKSIEEIMKEIINTNKDTFDERFYNEQLPKDDLNRKFGYLRAKAINSMTIQMGELFIDNIDEILKGNYSYSLSKDDNFKSKNSLNSISKINQKKLYKDKPVVQIEMAGYEILNGLLDIFLKSVFSKQDGQKTKKTLDLLPFQYHPIDRDTNYIKIMKVIDFISDMTEHYAIELYRRIKGINLPTDY